MTKKSFVRNILFLLIMQSMLVSCALVNPQPTSFKVAIRDLTAELMQQLPGVPSPSKKAKLVFNPFVDSDSGQVLKASLDIEEVFFDEIREHFKQFDIERTTYDALKGADYLIEGIIAYELYEQQSKAQKAYHITASVIDLRTKTVSANAQVWISPDTKLDYTATPSFQDNPMYIKDRNLDKVIETVKVPVGGKVKGDYYGFIETKSLLVEAQSAYDNKNYQQARDLFKQVVQHKAGQILEGYGGLYITNFKLGLMDEAEESFGRMVVVGIENGVLPIKFMFASNSTDFLDDPDLKKQYEIWLRQISLYFKEHPKTCLLIVGHTSLSGSDNANKKLSLQRAQAIQLKMQQIFQDITELSSTEGKGSEETIVGTSPDDEQNSIDRRVEFKIANCGATSK